MYTQLRLSVCASYQPLNTIYTHLIIQGAWGRGSWCWLSMSFYLAIGCQLWANAYSSNQPIWTQPKVSRGYTECKHHCSNLVWAHGPQYAPPAAAYTWGSGIGGKVAIWKLPSLSRCGNPQPDFLDSTKCFQPLTSAYTRHYKLWLGSLTLGWGCGTCRKCTKIMRRWPKLHFWGLSNNLPPTYLNPTKCSEPTSSDYTRPWKLWLASETSIGGAGGGTKMGLCTENAIFSAKLPFGGLCSNPQPTYLNPTKCFEPTYSDYTRPWKL